MPYVILGRGDRWKNLGGSLNPAYRGTDRELPPHIDHLSEWHRYHRLWHWYLNANKEQLCGPVDNFRKVAKLLRILRDDLGMKEFELVEVLRPGEPPEQHGEFLGYDVSLFYRTSLLEIPWRYDGYTPQNDRQHSALAIAKQIPERFFPLLNANGLFDDESHARALLEAVTVIEDLWPGFYLDAFTDFDVVALYKVDV